MQPAAQSPLALPPEPETPANAHVVCGDWLSAAGSLAPASIDLLYVDPPFNTGRKQRGKAAAFEDSFESTAAFIAWLRERLMATLPKIKATGSVLIHTDYRTSHRVRVLLDELLGEDRFVNQLIWRYGLGGSSPRSFARKHDDIAFYCVDPAHYYFQAPRIAATSRRMAGLSKKMTDVIDVPALGPASLPCEPGQCAVLDVPTLNNLAAERIGYPTQKPLALLKLLIGACCPPGGTVLDPCCGSGTTLVAARELGRPSIGFDQSPRAVEIAISRLA